MATATTPDQTLEYQHFIDYQLTRAQGRMKSVEIGTAVVRLVSAALVYLVVVIALDHTVILPPLLRLMALLAAFAAATGYCVVRIVLPAARRINHFYAARTIEQATPEFKNSLINFLDLRRQPDRIPPGVLGLLEERAVSDLSQIQVEEKINQDRLVRASYGLAGVVLATCIAVLFNALVMQRSLLDSLGRVLFPTADIQPPTQTRLTEIRPGDKSVVAHTSVTVSAIADGREPEDVTLHWSEDGTFWREQTMKRPDSGSQFDPWTTSLLVEKPLRYYLVGGDCRTKVYSIDVTQPPMVTDLELIYDYPEYTGWAPYTSRNGNIDALEGTTIRLTATTNRPVASGQIRFGNKAMGPAMQQMDGRDDQLSAQFTVTQNDSYIIWFVTEDGETNPRPASYEIKVRTDIEPVVTLKPGFDLVDPPKPANSFVSIGITAHDDFGIEEVKFYVAKGQEELPPLDLIDLQSPGREFSANHRLDLKPLDLNHGDEITYWVEVADNKQPRRNRKESPRYRIRVGSPLSPTERQDEEKLQIELVQAEDAARAARDAEREPADSQPPGPATDDSPSPENKTEDGQPAPKDERALDVIRKYLEEKDQATEQPRDPGQPGDSQQSSSTEEKRQDEKGAEADSKDSPENQSNPNPGETSKPESGEKGEQQSADGDKSKTEKKNGSESGQDSTGSKTSEPMSGSQKNGTEQSQGTKSGSEKSDGEKSGSAKSDESSSAAQKSDDRSSGSKPEPGKDKQGSTDSGGTDTSKNGSNKSEAAQSGEETKSGNQKSPGDKSSRDGSGHEKETPDGEKSTGEQSKSAEKTKSQNGTQSEKDKSGSEKSGSDASSGEPKSGEKVPSDAQGLKPSTGSRESGKVGDSAEKSGAPTSKGDRKDGTAPKPDGANGKDQGSQGTDKSDAKAPAGDKPPSDKSGMKAPESRPEAGDPKAGDEKSGAQPQGGESKPGAAKSDEQSQESTNPSGEGKPGSEKSGGEKPGSESPDSAKGAGENPTAPKTGEQNPADEKAGSEKSGEGKDQGDQAAGKAGEKPSGEQGDSDKGGGEKAGGEKKSGDGKASGQQSGDSKSGAGKTPGAGQKGSGKQGTAGGESKGSSAESAAKSGADSKAPGQGQGAGTTGGGSNASGERTKNPQPGGGENRGQGPIRDNANEIEAPSPPGRASGPDYRNEGSELVLDRLAKQLDKGDVDPELLRRLGWTRDELDQFVKEFSGPAASDTNTEPGDPTKKAKPREAGRTTLNESNVRSTRRGPGEAAQDPLAENYEGRRAKPAPEYEEHVRAYNMSQSKSDKSAAPSSGAKPK